MIYHIHSVEQDIASKWYARVVISEDESIFLKFHNYPSFQEIQNAAAEFVASYRPEEINAPAN